MHCPPHIDSTVTRTSKVWKGDDGILRLKFLANNFDFADAKTDFTLLSNLSESPNLLIVDFKKLRLINKEGKRFLENNKLTQNFDAIAILRKPSMITKLFGEKNTFFNKNINTQIFYNYEEAIDWIKKQS